ncbi:MAG: hypothetical protein OEW67_15065 [Cyclobacteriaceae bacterium]|nr:hypothetical protein [Cyclobacteriaceae bacterium]
MKKHSQILLFILLVSSTLFGQPKLSQDFRVTTGTPYQVVDAQNKEYFSDGDKSVISVKTRGALVIVQKFDVESMKEIARNEYEDFPKYSKVQKVLQLGNKLFYIFEAFNKSEDTFTVYSREVDMTNGTMLAIKKLFTTNRVVVNGPNPEGLLASFGMVFGSKFTVYKSFDNSKILINYRNKPLTRRDAENYDELGFYVFDANLEKQWGKEVKMPHTEKEMNNLAYVVGKNGTAYMLSYLNEAEKFELITVKKDAELTNKIIEIDASLKFKEFYVKEEPNGNLSCTGYYANGIEYKYGFGSGLNAVFNVNGIYNFSLTASGDLKNIVNHEFPIELINQYQTDRSQSKNEKREEAGKAGIADLKLRELMVDEANNKIYVGERYHTITKRTGQTTTTSFYYGNMVITKLNSAGEIVWENKLPKSQVGTRGRGGMGAIYIKGKDAHYLLFLDNVNNADISLNEKPKKHADGKGGFLTAFKIDDKTGAIEKHSILNVLDINGIEAFQFATSRILEVKDGVFLLETYIKGKKDTMIKMELLK